ncbi:MAG: serine/threonine-protein kinase [Myxococcota bacterium]
MTRRAGAPLVSGDVVGDRYRIEGTIGQGSSAIVYRASQHGLGRTVALKMLHPRYVEDPRARARFAREARVASALEHPSRVEIFDYEASAAELYLVMEYLQGAPLRVRAAELSSADAAIEVVWQTADILAAAHRAALVHRDLKPANIFVEESGRVRVLDFGLAFIASGGSDDRMTVEGVVAGTPRYLSPEQARGVEVGPPTDVYALGCVLFELLTGAPPFDGSEMDVLTKQMFAPAPSLGRLRSGFVAPAAIEPLLRAMLEKRPEDRPSAEEVKHQLTEARAGSLRGRATDDRLLRPRGERMVAPGVGEPRAPASEEHELAILGTIDPDLLVGLSANGIVAYLATEEEITGEEVAGEQRASEGDRNLRTKEPPTRRARSHGTASTPPLVYAPAASVVRVAALVAAGAGVMTDTDPSDMERIGALLRAGAIEVLPRPVATEELARRVHRARRIQKRRRP